MGHLTGSHSENECLSPENSLGIGINLTFIGLICVLSMNFTGYIHERLDLSSSFDIVTWAQYYPLFLCLDICASKLGRLCLLP